MPFYVVTFLQKIKLISLFLVFTWETSSSKTVSLPIHLAVLETKRSFHNSTSHSTFLIQETIKLRLFIIFSFYLVKFKHKVYAAKGTSCHTFSVYLLSTLPFILREKSVLSYFGHWSALRNTWGSVRYIFLKSLIINSMSYQVWET